MIRPPCKYLQKIFVVASKTCPSIKNLWKNICGSTKAMKITDNLSLKYVLIFYYTISVVRNKCEFRPGSIPTTYIANLKMTLITS